MQNGHIEALSVKHTTLDRRISDELQRPLPDHILLAHLKKQKLRVKDEMLT